MWFRNVNFLFQKKMKKSRWKCLGLKLSLSNWVFYRYPLDESIGLVKKLGFENLEFNMKCVENESEESVYRVKNLINFYGLNCLSVHAATLYAKNEDEVDLAILYGKVSLNFASQLSSKILVVHSYVSRKLPKNLRKKFLLKIFDRLKDYSKRLNVKLALENASLNSEGFGKTIFEFKEILDLIDDGSLDFCHAQSVNQTFDFLGRFANRLENVHLGSFLQGKLDVDNKNLKIFLKRLKDEDYDGPLTIEINPRYGFEEILKTKETVKKILDDF